MMLWLCIILILLFLMSIMVYTYELTKQFKAIIQKLDVITYVLIRRDVIDENTDEENTDIKDAEM